MVGDIKVQLRVEMYTPKGNRQSRIVECNGYPVATRTDPFLLFYRHDQLVLMINRDRVSSIEEEPNDAAAPRPLPNLGG